MLPDLTDFELVSSFELLDGVNVSKWCKTEVKGSKKNRYTMYINNDNNQPKRYDLISPSSSIPLSHY